MDNKKNVWIINQYAITSDMPGGTRHYDFSRELAKKGFNLIIFAGSFHYSLHKELKLGEKERYKLENFKGVSFFWIKTSSYEKNDWRRMVNMLSFAWRVYWVGRKLKNDVEIGKPEAIIGSSPHLFSTIAAYLLSIHYRVPFIMEVRDLWPQSLIEMGRYKKTALTVRVLSIIEKFLYKKAKRIIVLMPLAKNYIIPLGISEQKIVWISNGVALSDITLSRNINKNDFFKIAYIGAHGIANNLMSILDAAKVLQDKKEEKIRFIFVGDGAEKKNLLDYSRKLVLKNVEFRDPVEKKKIWNVFQEADVLIICLQKADIFRYGISPNKLFDYMASAKPIILCINSENNPVLDSSCGIAAKPDDPQDIARVALEFYRMLPEQRERMGKRGREYVEKNNSIAVLSVKLQKVIQDTIDEKNNKKTQEIIKRIIDIIGSAIGLLLVFPLFLVIAIIIKLESNGPVFFRYERIGKDGKSFFPFKFRTMKNNAIKEGLGLNITKDDQRITKIGRFLRKWGIDELPQLINVLKGEMSLVGPRPTLKYQVEHYTDFQRKRLLVKPGITGWALIHGRNSLTWEERIKYDVWYADHWSIWLDFSIMLKTLYYIFIKQEGVYGKGGINDPFI
jgi:lipopolysaccharide/colanic/teichoic acid biosynthesis glycosyltransferase